MKEYRVIKAKNEQDAERIMNDMARQGWEVVTVTFWHYVGAHVLITFTREI